jgi:hypothetical protein
MAEHRKEYDQGEIVNCPKCDGVNLDCDEAPDRAKCQDCGIEFRLVTVAVWEE